jgi:hypothetical protein
MSKDIYEMYKTEDEMEVKGTWKELGSTRVKIARTGAKNTLYSKVFKKVTKKYEKVSFEDLPEEELNAVLMEIFAKAIIKAWEIKDEKTGEWVSGMILMSAKGKKEVVPTTWENYKKCLIQLPDLHKILDEFSKNISSFQKEIEEKQLEN